MTVLDLNDCFRAREKLLAATDSHQAIRALVRRYLPALRDLAASTDPENIQAALATTERRLMKGADYVAPDVFAQSDADDRWLSLLEEYEVLMDALNLRHEGTEMTPARYWMDRIAIRMMMDPKEEK